MFVVWYFLRVACLFEGCCFCLLVFVCCVFGACFFVVSRLLFGFVVCGVLFVAC